MNRAHGAGAGCSVPDECPEEIAVLIKDCLSADPELRPSSTEAFHVLQQQASRAGPSPRGSTDVSMHTRHARSPISLLLWLCMLPKRALPSPTPA